jgi:Sulfotransferase family
MLPNGRSETDLEVRSPGKRAVYMMKQNSSTSRETPGETSEDLGHNPYVFIVGCSRSGTTLLQRLVDAHPVIAITSETNWVLRYFVDMKTGLTSEGLVTPEMIPRLIEQRRFPSLGIDPGDLERLITPSGHVSYSSFVSGVLDLYGGTRGKRLAGGKRALGAPHPHPARPLA